MKCSQESDDVRAMVSANSPHVSDRHAAGFTLVEVMVAMLIGTVGLMGTIAVQQAVANASKNANDAAVAMRLASQKLEELSSKSTDTQTADLQIGLAPLATSPSEARWYPFDSANQPIAEYVDAEGGVLRNSTSANPRLPTAPEASRYRWHRQWRVVNTGNGLPYVICVVVSYSNDVGTPKTVRLDLERRKGW